MWRALKYLQHLFYLRHRKGFGIHSPGLFELVNGVIFNAYKLNIPHEIRVAHRELRNDPTRIGPENRTVGSFVRRSSVSPRYGALLYRMARWFEPGTIIELGTGLGISTLYLAAGSNGVPLHTIEGTRARAEFSSHLIKRCGYFAVKVHVGEIGEVLERLPEAGEKRFLAFVDGNHHYGPTVTYLRKLMETAGEEALVIMDDIYWSRGMHRAWKEIIGWQEVRASIDLFHVGILWLRKDLAKTKLKMKF